MDASSVDFMRTLMENFDRKNDVILKMEKQMAEVEVERKEAAKDAIISTLREENATAKGEVIENRRIAEDAVEKCAEMEKTKVWRWCFIF